MLGIGDDLCLDAVSRPDAFALLWPKLRAGYLLDALERLDGRATSVERISVFVESVAEAHATRGPSAGLGEDVRLRGDGRGRLGARARRRDDPAVGLHERGRRSARVRADREAERPALSHSICVKNQAIPPDKDAMQSSRVERPEQLTLEVGGYSASVMSIAVTLVFVLVVGMLLNNARTNNDRAEDWRRRAVAAEEVAGGLRVVLAERSRTLNQRTRQANILIDTLASSRGALRETKGNLGALSARQRQLASQSARAEAERRKLQAQRAALVSVSSALSACSQDLASLVAQAQTGKPKVVLATAGPVLTRCNRARARLSTVRENAG